MKELKDYLNESVNDMRQYASRLSSDDIKIAKICVTSYVDVKKQAKAYEALLNKVLKSQFKEFKKVDTEPYETYVSCDIVLKTAKYALDGFIYADKVDFENFDEIEKSSPNYSIYKAIVDQITTGDLVPENLQEALTVYKDAVERLRGIVSWKTPSDKQYSSDLLSYVDALCRENKVYNGPAYFKMKW